ncbi:hypothetical protein O1L55_25945 [Streptomyces albulus]|nr:hypothetical protein [Streptomyces noursei]
MIASLRRKPTRQPALSKSEKLLFSGVLRHDKAWAQYEDPLLRLSFWKMARQFPAMMAIVARAAWREDLRALVTLLAAELGIGVMRAFTLVATNQVLVAVFSGGPTTRRLLDAAPALFAAAAVTAMSSLLSAVSVAASGRLEPKIERACTARYYAGWPASNWPRWRTRRRNARSTRAGTGSAPFARCWARRSRSSTPSSAWSRQPAFWPCCIRSSY